MRKLITILCLQLAACSLWLHASAQSPQLYVGSKYAFISDTDTGGYTTDTLFVVTGKYTYASFKAFGNGGEWATVRMYIGSTTTGTFLVPANTSVNIPNNGKTLPNFDVDINTLTGWVNELGDTIPPGVYCVVFK